MAKFTPTKPSLTQKQKEKPYKNKNIMELKNIGQYNIIADDVIIEDALGTHTFNDAIVSDTIIINGQEYHLDSPESEYSTTDWKYINGCKLVEAI